MISKHYMQRLIRVFSVLCGVVTLGTVGFVLIEDWPITDAFFMTMITISTVGYGSPYEMSEIGELFSSVLIIACMLSMTFWTAILTSIILEYDLKGIFTKRKMLKMISKMTKHTVICGTGQMAETVIDRLLMDDEQVVLIDENEARLEELREQFPDLQTVTGSPTCELSLAKANVLKAGSVVATTKDDMDNLLVAITCRDIDPEIKVIARTNDSNIANRMRKLGVEEVISPNFLCGMKIADSILQSA